MTCHRQAVDLLKSRIEQDDTLLDVGCGSGYFYHSLKNLETKLNYFGIDASRTLIEIGHREMKHYGVTESQLMQQRIEDTDGEMDHIVCINVLSNIDNYHKPLERMLKMAQKTLILRESFSDSTNYLYVKDNYLDADVDLKVHVNNYSTEEVKQFINSYGFSVEFFEDEYTGGKPQNVIDYPHYWKFLRACKED